MTSTKLAVTPIPVVQEAQLLPLARICIKPQTLDKLADDVIARLNTTDRKLGYHGKGVRGKFIPEDHIDSLRPSLRHAIGIMLLGNGIQVEGVSFPVAEEIYDVALKLRNALAGAYHLQEDGRVVRAAMEQIETVTMQLVNESRILPVAITHGLYRNF